MFAWIEKAVLGMAILRIISGTIEISAAIIMIKVNEVAKALMINSMLAFVGPIILITTTSIGLLGLSDRLSFCKIFYILIGIGLILYGVRK